MSSMDCSFLKMNPLPQICAYVSQNDSSTAEGGEVFNCLTFYYSLHVS